MDEYVVIARQAVKKKKKTQLSLATTYHCKSGLSQHCNEVKKFGCWGWNKTVAVTPSS